MQRPARVVFLAVVLLLSYAVSISSAFAQEATLAGVVKDRNTHQEIRGVNVFVKGSDIGTATDFSGQFRFNVPNTSKDLAIVFQHIGYLEKEMAMSKVAELNQIYLQPRVIPLRAVEVEEEGLQKLEIQKDLPQRVDVIGARDYEIRGYVDAGDLLRIDHSVQVDEKLSGKKTVGIRGGNADEVVVLFNGVKMNNAYDNVFDLSLIDLEDVERFELIKGSNTALYGPEAFSGVINIVPKTEQDYTVRFQQRVGTYQSGNWGLHFYKRFNRFRSSYSIKRGGSERTFVDDAGRLDNSSFHHTANLNLDLGTNSLGRPRGSLGVMWIYSDLDFDNGRDQEQIDNSNNLVSLKYSGELFGQKGFDLSVSHKKLEEDQGLTFDRRDVGNTSFRAAVDRNIDDKAIIVNTQKLFEVSDVDLLVAYQFQRNTLDFLDRREGFLEEDRGLEGADLHRNHHGLVTIVKYHGDTGSDFFQTLDVDFSLRHDRVQDREDNAILRGDVTNNTGIGRFDGNDWNKTMFKFAMNLTGYRDNLSFNGYFNFGSNTKFSTLFQQVNSPAIVTSQAETPSLEPERNRSFELGFDVSGDTRDRSDSIYGWKVSGSYFQNQYTNKFREFNRPGDPVTFFDNVQNADISGFEGKSSVYLFEKKISVDLGISQYFISDRLAFPFKSEHKRTLTISLDHAGYSLQTLWFRESEQVGLLRAATVGGTPVEAALPAQTNLDFHLSKTFEVAKFKLFGNFSGRNLLNDKDVVLEGLSIRDRRFYFTIGAQY